MTFVAFPHRGEELPGVPWLGETMNRAADAMPTLDEDEHPDDGGVPSGGQPPGPEAQRGRAPAEPLHPSDWMAPWVTCST